MLTSKELSDLIRVADKNSAISIQRSTYKELVEDSFALQLLMAVPDNKNYIVGNLLEIIQEVRSAPIPAVATNENGVEGETPAHEESSTTAEETP